VNGAASPDGQLLQQMTARNPTPHAMRIIALFPELLGVGGVQEAGRQTAAALEEIALRVEWLTFHLSLNDPPGTQFFLAGERKITLQGFGRSKLRFLLSAISQARQKMGLVLAAHPHMAPPASWMKWFSPRLKTVVMSHGVEVWEPLSPLRRNALRGADLVMAPSRDTAQKLADVQGVSPKKIRQLAWPLSPNFLHWADAPTELPLPEGFPRGQVILTVGRWAASERYKGADELIGAVAQLRRKFPDLHLVAVGGGDDLGRLQNLASQLGVSDCVHFFDGISRKELAACYAHADIFALPSTGEGFGLVFLEAMAFARPLVGAACGGTTDLVKDGVNGLLVPPRDSERLAEALNRLLRDGPLCAELGRRGSEIVRQKFGFEAFRSGLEQILSEAGLDSGRSA
jgi:phosphatidyl-myo-inositol dimannoside synthase